MQKPVIGLLGVLRRQQSAALTISGKPQTFLAVAYTDSVAKNGGIPMVIPFPRDMKLLRDSLKLCHGVVIPGGIDADPRYFGEEPHSGLGEVDRELDEMQMAALEYLFEDKVPVLGICRGCQMMNIFTGGTLYQDLGEFPGPVNQHRQSAEPWQPWHTAELTPGSRVADLFAAERIRVNSFHHQAVRDVGRGFSVTAKSPDGVIEAIEHENGIWMGVQWHPEQMTSAVPEMNVLFRDLVEKSAI